MAKKIPTANKYLKPTIVPGRVILKLKKQPARDMSGSIPTGRQSMAKSLGLSSVDDILKKYNVKSISKLRAPSPDVNAESAGVGTPRIVGESATTHENFAFTRTFIVNIDPKSDVKALVQELKNNPEVEEAHLDYFARAEVVPNDPLFQDQWGLVTIKCPEVWEITKGSEDVIISIVDTGVDRGHPDLRDKLVPGFDMVNVADVTPDQGCVWEGDIATRDDDPDDENGHGTHCAGIAAGITDNDIGIAGVAWNSKVMPVRVLANMRCTRGDSSTFVTGTGLFSDIADGIIWAADHGAKVISLSLGGLVNKSDSEPEPMKSAIDYAISKGCVVVAAMGNDGADLDVEDVYHYPSKHASVLAVGAIDKNNQRASFSNYGDYKHVMAPGVSIRSTYFGSRYADMDGTSMATPFVSGVAALVRSANPQLAPKQVIDIIRQSSISSDQYGKEFGFGLINAEAAVKMAMGGAGGAEPEPVTSLGPFISEVSGSLARTGDEKTYKVSVSNKLTINLDGPEGSDFDIYVKKGSPPTRSSYDSKGYSSQASETLAIQVDESGDYYIMVRSYEGSGNFKLKVRRG